MKDLTLNRQLEDNAQCATEYNNQQSTIPPG